MEIVKSGAIEGQRRYFCMCRACKCKFKFMEWEAEMVRPYNAPDYIRVVCPQDGCGTENSVNPAAWIY